METSVLMGDCVHTPAFLLPETSHVLPRTCSEGYCRSASATCREEARRASRSLPGVPSVEPDQGAVSPESKDAQWRAC